MYNILYIEVVMRVQTFKRVKLGLMVGLVVTAVVSIWIGLVWPVFMGLLVYMFLVSLIKTRVNGVLADERQVQVGEKAAQVSFQILLPLLMLTSVALMMGGGSSDFYYVRALGIVVSYVTILGLVIYLLSYWYFDRQSGGIDGD